MKPYYITEGELSHACTSIAHHRDGRNRQLNPDGRADPRSRSASHARGVEAGHQTMGRSKVRLPSLWGKAAPTGGNRTPGDRHDVRTRSGAPTTLSLPGVWASLVSSHEPVQRTERRNDQPALARSGHAGRMLLALSSGQQPAQAAEWSPDQCRRDPFADQSGRPATSGAAASGGRADMLLCGEGGESSTAGRATHAGGVGWRLGV